MVFRAVSRDDCQFPKGRYAENLLATNSVINFKLPSHQRGFSKSSALGSDVGDGVSMWNQTPGTIYQTIFMVVQLLHCRAGNKPQITESPYCNIHILQYIRNYHISLRIWYSINYISNFLFNTIYELYIIQSVKWLNQPISA